MNYITWNDAVEITSIPYAYMCDICKERIMDKKAKAIRVNWPSGKTSNHYFHDRHEAIQYADWLHVINNKIKDDSKAT